MDVEVFIHGVPHGDSLWGKEEDRKYFDVFYNDRISDAIRFSIQTRQLKDKTYCYYNYLVYKNVIGNDGRNGSYFGITIRFDAYCKDFMNVYEVLDIVFTTHVLNAILKKQNGNYKYVVADFQSESEKMKRICDVTLQLINSALTNESFCSFDGFIVGNGKQSAYNIYELTMDEVKSKIKKHGMILLSPYYRTVREENIIQQSEARENQVRQQLELSYKSEIEAKENNIKSLISSLESVKKENDMLRTNIEKAKSSIKQKKEIIANLENQIKEIEKDRRTVENLDLIKEPVRVLAGILGGSPKCPRSVSSKPKKKRLSTIIVVIQVFSLLLIIAVFILLWSQNSKKANLQNSVLELQNKIEAFECQNANSENEYNLTSEIVHNTFNKGNKLRIDVSSYNENRNRYLRKSIQNEATILNSKDPQEGEWDVKGGHIEGSNKGRSIKFIPEDDNIVITFRGPDGEETCRTLKVED